MGKELELAPEVIDAEIVGEVVAVHEGPYVQLSENNSGGSFWLSDADWYALEEAGWVVEWVSQHVGRGFVEPVLAEDGKYRYMGQLATRAKRYGVSQGVAAAEFKDITGQDVAEEGCECCGPPHYLSTHDGNGNYI